MKIAFFEIEKWEERLFRKKLKGHKLLFFNETLNLTNVSKIKDFDIISTFIYSKIDKKILSKLPKLKMIVTRSTGYDHINMAETRKRKITICNVPSYGENTVAEHAFALILALSRKVHKSYVRIQKGDYSIKGLKGFDLMDKTIGVIGAGKIGLHVIRIAKGFGMNVLAYDMYPNHFLAEVMGFKYADLNEVLKKSDIISLHIPYTKQTNHLINSKTINLMKKGVIIINTSRGGVVDTKALLNGLNSKKIGGAGLDVIEGEKLIKEEKQFLHKAKYSETKKILETDYKLLSKDNVVFTPHIAFYSQEALERILDTTVDCILKFIDKKPVCVVK